MPRVEVQLPQPPAPLDRTVSWRDLSWRPAFLESMARYGEWRLAAHACGIPSHIAWIAHQQDRDFADQVAEAKELYADLMQHEMLEIGRSNGTVNGHIAFLKAKRPREYLEKSAVLNMNVSAEASPADMLSLLRAVVQELPADARHALTAGDPSTGQIIDQANASPDDQANAQQVKRNAKKGDSGKARKRRARSQPVIPTGNVVIDQEHPHP